MGQCGVNILRELFKRDIEVSFHCIGQPDLSAYSLSQEFHEKLQRAFAAQYDALDAPSLKLWHLSNGGECRIGRGKSTLFTFHETSEATQAEKSVVSVHDKVIVSSSYTKSVFGALNMEFVPLGLDPELYLQQAPKKFAGRKHWGLMGKWEKRKNTTKIIQNWIKKYGNSSNHILTCYTFNHFLPAEHMNALIHEATGGKKYHNIQILPPLKTNAEVNDYINSIDVELSGLSGAEGFGLPAFNATCLGKWCPVTQSTAHLDWSNEDNCVPVKTSNLIDSSDGVFFSKGNKFNQGGFYEVTDEMIQEAFAAIEKKSGVNEAGLELGRQMTWEKSVDRILEITL